MTIQFSTAVNTQREDLQPFLREEDEVAVAELKKGKTARPDNIPEELVQAGGQTMVDVLTKICNKVWKTGKQISS